jgi:hypothetical protein
VSKVPDTRENMMKCICGTCPTFKQSLLGGGLYCAKGKAGERVEQVGCACVKCPLLAKYKLKGSYFCYSKSDVISPSSPHGITTPESNR